MNRLFGHLRNIIVHKYWVYQFGSMMGINIWRLLMHDMSKFSPIEFWESVKYYQGTSSPIPACKKDKEYSNTWQHHKGRNPHHYEYWTDNYDYGTRTLIPMPFEYIEEMIADWCAAGRTYQGEKFTFKSQCEWWESKRLAAAIHPETKYIIDLFFSSNEDDPFKWWNNNKKQIKYNYLQNISNKI